MLKLAKPVKIPAFLAFSTRKGDMARELGTPIRKAISCSDLATRTFKGRLPAIFGHLHAGLRRHNFSLPALLR